MEEWRDINGYEGLYQISSLGRIKRLAHHVTRARFGTYICKEKICQCTKQHDGYMMKYLSKNGKKSYHNVHRLVAEAFIPNPLNLPFVNHKNEKKHDNRVENLEWCTAKYNTNYGTCLERRAQAQRNRHGSIPVVQMDLEWNDVAEYPSIMEAYRSTGISARSICKCCMGKDKSAHGTRWRYKFR